MEVTITARHAKFTDAMKEIALEKAHHLERYFHHLKKIEVILDIEGDKDYRVEMIASGVRGHVLVAHNSAQTALAALDQVVEKMERQLVKLKEKLTSRHVVSGEKALRFEKPGEGSGLDERSNSD